MRILELCAGYGGLGLGVRIAIPSARVVCAVERQAYCAALLLERMEEATMGEQAIWPDVESFAWAIAKRNRARLVLPDPRKAFDMLTAGFPCQPFSVAGRRSGTADSRWIWSAIRRTIGLVRPRYVFLENVPGILVHSGGFGTILSDLAALGYDVEWDRMPAADIGANHFRFRIWILAYAANERHRRSWGTWNGRTGSENKRENAEHALRIGRDGESQQYGSAQGTQAHSGYDAEDDAIAARGGFSSLRRPSRGEGQSSGGDETDTFSARSQEREGQRSDDEPQFASAERASHAGRRPTPSAPGRVDDGTTAELGETWYANCPYSPEEWLSTGEPDRAEQLHALGNGCLPLQVAYSLVRLAERAGIGKWTKNGLVMR